jgi:hypothetical protein
LATAQDISVYPARLSKPSDSFRFTMLLAPAGFHPPRYVDDPVLPLSWCDERTWSGLGLRACSAQTTLCAKKGSPVSKDTTAGSIVPRNTSLSAARVEPTSTRAPPAAGGKQQDRP